MSMRDLDDFDTDELNHDILERLTKWTEVLHHSHEHPELVLQVLLKCHEYGCARQWAKIHKANRLMLQVTITIMLTNYSCELEISFSPSSSFEE